MLIAQDRAFFSGFGGWSETPMDVQLSDGTDIVDYLQWYG